MTLVAAPPSMQPWIRQTDSALRSMHATLARLEAAARAQEQARQYLPVAASLTDVLTAPAGITNGWALAGSGLGPDVVVTTVTGQILVTLASYMTATWDVPTDAAMAYGAMGVSAYGPLDIGGATDAALHGAARSFSYVPGQPGPEDDTVATVIDLRVPPGTYTLRSEYLYQNFTAGIQIKWSNRTLVAEPK